MRTGKVDSMMREQRRLLGYSSVLLAVLFTVACGNPPNPPPAKWTSENPSAPPSTAAAKPAPAKPEANKDSSLEALRRGEAAGSGPMADIGFDFDSAALSEKARGILKTNAEWLKANPAVKAQVEGHCDERGTAEYNMALGAKRAQAAMDYLTTLGVAANRLSTVSYGEEIPVCREHTEDCWVKNRRARFVASGAKPVS
jgi:peptidoglycan-associated lipoprotein